VLLTSEHRAIGQTALSDVTGTIRVSHDRPGIKSQNLQEMMGCGRGHRDHIVRPRLRQVEMGGVTHLPASAAFASRPSRSLPAKLGEAAKCFFLLTAEGSRYFDLS